MSRSAFDDGIETRTLPHSLEAERAVLGAMLLNNDRIDDAVSIVGAADFYRDAHQCLVRHVLALHEKRSAVDLVTVRESLSAAGELERIGGPVYLAALVDGVPRSMNVEHYARIVKEKATRRALIFAAIKIQALAYDPNELAADILETAHRHVLAVTEGQMIGGGFLDAPTWMAETLTELERRMTDTREIPGVPSGFVELDQMLGGFQPGGLYFIAARPSMGKTALAQAIAVHAATVGEVQVGIFSLEMNRRELALRMLASEASLSTLLVQRPKLLAPAQWAKLSATMNRLRESGLHIDDSSNLTVFDIRAKARQLRAKHGLGLLIIDYLQLMGVAERAENRNLEIAAISRNLKLLARDLDVPVIVLSQLSREPDKRGDHEPQLSDLRDSGSLEQDADVVIFPYRPEVYGATDDNRGVAKLVVAKQRNGPVGPVVVSWIAHLTRFEDRAGMDRRLT